MIKTFTQNDVIRLIYNEVSQDEKADIVSCLLWDQELADFYSDIQDVKLNMTKAKKEPSAAVIDNILNYSRNFVRN
ncbi:MAG: hypothetical protein ACK40G_03930 [Cytophagaceae bacterium]